MFALAEAGELEGWTLDLSGLPLAAQFVARIVRQRYPDLDVPLHARWRHLVFYGVDVCTLPQFDWPSLHDYARAAFDCAIVSVLLDAGAGPHWRYRDALTELELERSEGLAMAAWRMFETGTLSSDPERDAFRADAAKLTGLDTATLADVFQVRADNPLLAFEGRVSLMNRLGLLVSGRPELFAREEPARPGGLYDVLRERADGGALPAPVILETLLDAFGPLWENRPMLGGVPLGDCWLHAKIGYTPLHKLSQWLAYSLVEPLGMAGIGVTDLDGLTGLAEYRNGGLFVDMRVLNPRDTADMAGVYRVNDPFVVEWRALTVALLDRIAPLVRERLGVSAAEFPLARVLQGGTWEAGRTLAAARDGRPPFRIDSDGTVF